MKIIGLTGSIGMGKTTALEIFAQKGIPTFDADAAVHHLYQTEAVAPIEQAFPGTLSDGAVDRAKLSLKIMDNPQALKKLESIVHPLVQNERQKFLNQAAEKGSAIAVLDIPLLFEIGAQKDVDVTVVVSAPAAVQQERVMGRPGMTKEKFEQLLARQMPDEEKRARSDYIVETDQDIEQTRADIDKLIEIFKKL